MKYPTFRMIILPFDSNFSHYSFALVELNFFWKVSHGITTLSFNSFFFVTSFEKKKKKGEKIGINK